jgi:hypothetical protein
MDAMFEQRKYNVSNVQKDLFTVDYMLFTHTHTDPETINEHVS